MKTSNSKGWIATIDANELDSEVISLGKRHSPVKHSQVLEMFKEKLELTGFSTTLEKGFLSRDYKKFMYVADIKSNSFSARDYTWTAGFCNFNDERKAFTPIFGETVFVCTNQMIRSENFNLKTRHTGDVSKRISNLLDDSMVRANDYFNKRANEINRLKETEVKSFKDIVLKMISSEAAESIKFLKDFINEFENPRHNEFKSKSLWSLQNAYTEVLKTVSNPVRRVELGNKFGTVLQAELK